MIGKTGFFWGLFFLCTFSTVWWAFLHFNRHFIFNIIWENLNWKNIAENWEKFVEINNLVFERNRVNYFYGREEIILVKEYYEGFEILYTNKLNKSTVYGSSMQLGHRMKVISAIVENQNMDFKIKKTSLWNELIRNKQKLSIVSNFHIEEILSLNDIEKLVKIFPDLSFSIKNFNIYQHPIIPFEQKVLQIETNHQPTELHQLQLLRTVIIEALKKYSKIEV